MGCYVRVAERLLYYKRKGGWCWCLFIVVVAELFLFAVWVNQEEEEEEEVVAEPRGYKGKFSISTRRDIPVLRIHVYYLTRGPSTILFDHP